MAKKKTLYKADFSNSKQRAAEYAEAYRQKRQENKSFVEPLANNKDYRTQQAKKFAELSGANATTNKNKTGRETITPESWVGGTIQTKQNGPTTTAKTNTAKTATTAKTTTTTRKTGPKEIIDFSKSRQMANSFADKFREQKRDGTLPGRTTSIYDVARQAVDDARREKDYRAKAADALGLTGKPITNRTLQREMDSAYRKSMLQRGNPALNGISRDIARPRAARTDEIRNMALERMQAEQREKAEQEQRRQQDRIENRKDGYAQVSQAAEPLESKGQRLLDSLAGRKSYAELAGSRNINDRKDGPVAIDKRKPNLNGYVPEDNTYEKISQDPDFNLYKLKGKTSFYDPDYQAGIDRMFGASPVDYMTQEQKDTYNYIYGRYGRDAVKEYEKSILPELNRMMQEDVTQRAYEEARNNPLKGLASDLTNAMWAPRGAFESAVNVITGNPIDTNSRAFIGTNAQAAAHQGLVDSAKDTFGDNYMTNVLAEGGLGMVENASRYWMGPAGLTFMGMQAASSGIKEAKDRGATDEQAMAVGITNGIVEYLTEQVSLGNLENVTKYTENPIKSAKDFARAVALNFGVEASEEMASEILDTAADYMIMQDNSNLMRNYRGYLEQGMTEEQAKQAVVGDFIRDVANAGIVGGITGAGMSGIAGTYNLAMNKANENAINRFITQDYARRGMMPTETASQMLENIAKEAEQEQKGPSISDINEWASSEREDVSNPVYDAYREAGENLADSFEGEEGKKAFLDIPLADRTKAYRAFAAYYNLGYRGTEISPEMQEQASKVLTLQQMSDAMNAGAKDQQVNYPMQQVKAVEDAAKKVNIPETKEGKVYYDKKRYQYWTSQQKLRVNYAGALISKVFGLDTEFFESVVGEDGKYYDAESYNDPNRENELARNGAFYISPRTGRPTIMLDINAGMNKASDWTGDISDIKTLFPIISHEMTHYMEQYAPEHYKALSDTITNALINNSNYTKGLTLNQMIQSQRIRMETRDNKTYTNDDALREIVARACEDMLSGNEDAVEAFQSMNKDTQRYVWNHVKKIFDNIRDFFRQMLTEYRSGSAEAQAIRQNMEEFEKIRAKWQEALGFATTEGRNAEFKSAVNAETETGTPDSFVNGVSKDGVTTGGKSGAQFSERTYQNGGREYLKMWLETQSDLSEEDRKDVVFQIDSVYNIMQKVKEEGGLEGYTAWSNVEERDGVLTVVVPNGEYPLNIDFSTVCKKRKALDHILNVMIQNEQLSAADLAGKDIVRLQQIIKSEGLEIACALCFVDAKRYRIGEWAERITAGKDTGDSHQYGFNELLDSLIPEGSKLKIDEHNFTERDIKQPKGKLLKNAPDDQLDFTLVDRLINNSSKSSWNYKAAKTIRENPDVRSYLNPAELLSSIGFDPIKVQSPAIFNLINQSGGASKPKLSFSEVPYLNDILMNQQMTPEQAYKVGGVRIQSFSDFMANMVFDYVQMVGELQAKKLPAHAYTKEASFVAIFGKTGIKINMSLVPKATTMTQEEIRKYITQFDTKKKRQQAYNELKKRAGLDENGNYLWEDETFPYEVAMHFQADPEYAKNCGTIAVGVSDAHIRKLLADPTIQMVIPYHTSGINKTIAKMRGIDLYTDYTKQQTTKNRATGKSITASQNTFDFYKVLQETGDPKKTADEYLKWCDENNFIPKFSKFAKGEGSENYYKLLIDFRVYDENGEYAPQQAVQAIYPSEDLMKEYILNGYTYTAEDGTVYQNGGLRAAQETSDKLEGKTEEIIRRYNAGETGKEEVKVQNSSRDSDGNMLTDNQEEYFKDSKVRDADGNLIPVYHGTNAEFYEFSKDYIGSHGSFEGAGFNFTPSRTRAGGYKNIGENAGRVMEGYLNITKPLSDSKKTMSARNLANLIRSIDPTGDNIISNYARDTRDYGQKSFITRESLTTARAIFDFADSDVDIYSELSAAGADPKTIIDAFEKLGYDGLIHHTDDGQIKTLIAFESNQFKNIDNENPTENPDIRYSSREETIEIGTGNNKETYKTDELTKRFSEESKSKSAEISMASTKSEILKLAKDFYSKYQSGTANENNYFINTIAEFKETSRPRRNPDYVSRTRDGSVSSEYWYTDDGVIRGSKHWGEGVASCDWFLEDMGTEMDTIKLYGEAKWGDFVQKTEIVTNDGEATISTFDNTVGGKKGRYGFMTPVVQGLNDGEKMQYASRDDDLAASIWDEVVAERDDEKGRDSVFFMDDEDPTKVTYQQQEYMEQLSKTSETAQAMNAAMHQVIGEGKKVDVDKFAKEQARKLRLNFGSKADKTELQDAIKSLCGLMNDAIQKDANRIAIAASNIGSEVMHNIMVDDDSMSQMYPTLKKELLSYKMKPSEKAKKDMAYAYDTYQSFRRRAFNKLTLVGDDADRFIRVDSAYMELSEKYPELFPADVENESDQLLLMMEVAQELNGKTIPMVEAFGTPEDEIDATAYMIGQDILSDYYKAAGTPAFGGVLDSVRRDLVKSQKEEIREAVKKKNEKIQKQAEQIRELKAKLEEKNLDAKEAAKYQKDLDHLEKLNALARQQERYEGKIGKLRGKLDENKSAAREAKRYQAALLRMQMRFDKRLSKIKVKQLDREARTRLLNAANRLAKMKGGPEFEARREALIGDLDIIAKGLRSDTKKALEDLKAKAEKLAAEDQDYALVGYPKDKAVFERLSKRHVNEMTGTEVSRLTEAILELENSEYISKRMLRRDEQIRVFTAAGRVMRDVRNAKGINGRNALGSTLGRYALNMLNPVRALARLDGYAKDGELTRLGKELNDGQTKMNEFMMRTSKKFNSFLEKHQNLADTWYQSDIDTGLKDKDGNPVMINKGMRISLYLHSRNAHNMNHIIRSGLEIPDAKLYRAGKYEEAYRYNTSVKLKVADVNRILGGMTEDEKAFANLAYEFFNKDTKDAINETSLELNGVYKAVVDNYFPIKADKNFTKGDVTGLQQDATIEGWNNLKERRTDAATLILLEDVAAVIQRQSENTAKYYGLAIPVRNFNKVLKWSEPNINGNETKKSVRSVINDTWGSAGISYIDTLLRDIQTGARTDEGPGAKIFTSLKSTYAGTVLNWNIGVSIKQAASAPFAAVVLDAKSVAKAFSPTTIFKKADLDYMDSITPWSYMRRQGMSGTEMGEVYKPQNMIQKSGPVKWLKKNTNFIQAVDVWTTNRLFFATEYYVQDHFPDLTYRGEAYNRKVAEVYNNMLQRTQPSYDVMQRNAFLRSDSPFTKVFGMFKTQTFNMGGEVIDSWGRLTAYEKMHKTKQVSDAQLKKVKKQFGKTVGATIASQLMLTALGVLAKAVYHNMKNYRDDKGEVTAESIIGRALYEFATSFSGLFMLGTEAQSLGLALAGREKWYDLEYPGLSTVNDFLTNANNTTEAFRAAMESGWDADKADDFRKKCMELAMSGMIMGRIPADNIYKFANGIYLHVQDIKDGKFGSFEAGEGLFGLRNSSVTKDQYAQRAAAAYAAGDTEAGDEAAEKTTKKKLQKAMYGVDEDASKAMVEYVAAGGSKEEFTRGKDLAKEIEEKDIKGDDVYAYVVASKDFTNEEKVAWFKTSTQRTGSKKYTAWKDAGYGDWDFIKYRSDLSKFSGDGKQEKIVNYIKKQTTDTKKRKALWMLAGYKESSYDKNMN